MRARATRVGLGYDAHAFAAPEQDRPLILGGVPIPSECGLLGHSDADVLAHAVTDAVLGALRAGDIGEHFPDTDPAFKDADSLALLARVGEMVRERGWRIVDVDAVVVAQAPRLSPYRDKMRARLAGALGLDVGQVGVKATTTEGLGFEGRGEGIGAHAVALLEQGGEPCGERFGRFERFEGFEGQGGEPCGEQPGERSGEPSGEGCAC